MTSKGVGAEARERPGAGRRRLSRAPFMLSARNGDGVGLQAGAWGDAVNSNAVIDHLSDVIVGRQAFSGQCLAIAREAR